MVPDGDPSNREQPAGPPVAAAYIAEDVHSTVAEFTESYFGTAANSTADAREPAEAIAGAAGIGAGRRRTRFPDHQRSGHGGGYQTDTATTTVSVRSQTTAR